MEYLVAGSRWGDFGLIWEEVSGAPRIIRLFLPGQAADQPARIQAAYPEAREGSHPLLEELAGGLGRFLEGQDVSFAEAPLALERCPAFQARVLEAERAIPRGWVSTYGRLASRIGHPGAARAVGGALAGNPFPLLIPCHRAVRSTGELGGFQGGLELKRALLEMEGVLFASRTRVLLERVYY